MVGYLSCHHLAVLGLWRRAASNPLTLAHTGADAYFSTFTFVCIIAFFTPAVCPMVKQLTYLTLYHGTQAHKKDKNDQRIPSFKRSATS